MPALTVVSDALLRLPSNKPPFCLENKYDFSTHRWACFLGGAAGAAASPQNRLWSPPNCRGSDKKNEIPAKGRQPKCEAGLEVGLPRK